MSAESVNRELTSALIDELAVVVGAMIDAPTTVQPGTPTSGRQWVAQVRAEGALEGAITLVLEHAGLESITRAMTGIDGDIPDTTLADTLRDVLGQVVSALALKPAARAARLTVADVAPSQGEAPAGQAVTSAIAGERLETALVVTAWGDVSDGGSDAPVASAVDVSSSSTPSGERSGVAAQSERALDDRIDVLLDIDLPLVVRFGRTELPLRALTRLGPGSIIDLARAPEDPVELLVSNRVVARGEVVIVAGSYGIRILDVVSQRERVRSMEV
jgi:flagellar motor switch protein FliN